MEIISKTNGGISTNQAALLGMKQTCTVVGLVHPFLPTPLHDSRNESSYNFYKKAIICFQRHLPSDTPVFAVVQRKHLLNLLPIMLKLDLGQTPAFVREYGSLKISASMNGTELKLYCPDGDMDNSKDAHSALSTYGMVSLAGIRNALYCNVDAVQNAADSLARFATQAGFKLEVKILDELCFTLPHSEYSKNS